MIGVDPYLLARLGEAVQSSGLEVRFDCPQTRCVARRHQKGSDKKLYVNFSKNVFYCMRCGWGGKVDDLYKSLGITRENVVHAPADLREAIGFLDEERVPSQPDESKDVYIPKTNPDWRFSGAYDWLWNRLSSVPQEEVLALVGDGMIRLGSNRHWDRVFFCDVYRGSLRYWTARTYLPDVNPKYLNPYNVPRRNVLFNQQRAEDQKYEEVIICEGTISAIVAGPNAVSTYGRCVTNAQIEILMSLPASRFIIASESDRDAKKNTLALAETLTRRSRRVYILDLPEGKDPADLGRDAFQKLLGSAILHDWESKILRRLSCL